MTPSKAVVLPAFLLLVAQPQVDEPCYNLDHLFLCYEYFGELRLLSNSPALGCCDKTWRCKTGRLGGDWRWVLNQEIGRGLLEVDRVTPSLWAPPPGLQGLFQGLSDGRASSLLSYSLLVLGMCFQRAHRYRTLLTQTLHSLAWPGLGQTGSKQEYGHCFWRWGLLCEADRAQEGRDPALNSLWPQNGQASLGVPGLCLSEKKEKSK